MLDNNDNNNDHNDNDSNGNNSNNNKVLSHEAVVSHALNFSVVSECSSDS